MAIQTIQFESVSLAEIGSGTLTAFLFDGETQVASLASITESGTLAGRYTGTVDSIAAGEYRFVVKFDDYTVSDSDDVVTLEAGAATYIVGKPGTTLATTQPSITWQAQTFTAGDGTPNITLAGSGNADGIAWTRSGSGDPLDADIVDQIQSELATQTGQGTTQDRLGYVLAALAGACADAGTAAETYAITIGADTFTIDHTGLDATGNRGTAVLTKS